MLDTLLISSPWFALAVGMALFVLDLALSVAERYLYHSGAKEVIAVQGPYGLKRPYRAQDGWRQFWIPSFTLTLIGAAIAIPAAWYVFTRANRLEWVFVFSMGGLFLFELTECIRLGRLITLYRIARRNTGLSGRVEVQPWVINNIYVVDQFGMSILFLLAFVVSGSMFFLGGAASCFIFSHRVRDYVAVKQKPGMHA